MTPQGQLNIFSLWDASVKQRPVSSPLRLLFNASAVVVAVYVAALSVSNAGIGRAYGTKHTAHLIPDALTFLFLLPFVLSHAAATHEFLLTSHATGLSHIHGKE